LISAVVENSLTVASCFAVDIQGAASVVLEWIEKDLVVAVGWLGYTLLTEAVAIKERIRVDICD
jgi:hypothetical protein